MRYYSAQFSNGIAGWADIKDGAFRKKKQSEKVSVSFAHKWTRATRVIRKPKGWEPSDNHGLSEPSLTSDCDLRSQVQQARAIKL